MRLSSRTDAIFTVSCRLHNSRFFFLKIGLEESKSSVRASHAQSRSPFSAFDELFVRTVHFNTQRYGLFCSLRSLSTVSQTSTRVDMRSIASNLTPQLSCVGAARKVSPDWLQKTMTCHSFNCFSIVWGQGWTPLVPSPLSSCYMTTLSPCLRGTSIGHYIWDDLLTNKR